MVMNIWGIQNNLMLVNIWSIQNMLLKFDFQINFKFGEHLEWSEHTVEVCIGGPFLQFP